MSVASSLDPAALVRPELRRLAAYTLDLSPCRHKLDQNEMPWELPRALKERAAGRIAAVDWARYPDFHQDALRRALGERHDWPWQGVLVGNGSNELLSTTLTAVCRPGSRVLGCVPSFGLYPMMALAAGAELVPIGPREDLRLAIDELAAEIDRDPGRPVVLCSPNNPTGEALGAERIAALLDRLEAPLLLDVAYVEFSERDYRPLLDRYPQLVLFGTLSKAWSLGGLRIGYLLARPELVSELVKVKLPYNVGQAAALAALAALAAPAAVRRRVATVVGRRPQWRAMLEGHGLEVFPSEANFHLVRCGLGPVGRERAATVREALAARGIRVRDVGHYPGLAGCLRISVGDGAALRAVDAALTTATEAR